MPTEHLRAPCGLEPQMLLHTNTIKILPVLAAKSLSLWIMEPETSGVLFGANL